MLRSRDIELIAGLVEGTLEDESEARALIARSDEARAEYDAQKLAFETLSSVPPARLADHERSALRRDLWTTLQSDSGPAPKRAPWYFKWAPVAAGLFVVVGLAAVLTRGGEQQAADSFAEIANGLATETTQAAADSLEPAADDSMESEEGEDADTATAPLSASPAEFFEDVAAQVRSGSLEDSATLTRDGADTESSDPMSCIETAGLANHDVFAEVADSLSSDEPLAYLVAVPSGEDPGPETPVSFVSVDTCEVVYVDG